MVSSSSSSSSLSSEDENILKSALAFVVLRRRVQLRKDHSNVSSSLPLTFPCRDVIDADTHSHGNSNSNRHSSSHSISHSHSVEHFNEKNDDSKGTLPFLKGISLISNTSKSSNKTNSNRNGSNSNSKNNSSSASNSLTSLSKETSMSMSTSMSTSMSVSHVMTMLRVARSTTLSLYSNVIKNKVETIRNVDTDVDASNEDAEDIEGPIHLNTAAAARDGNDDDDDDDDDDDNATRKMKNNDIYADATASNSSAVAPSPYSLVYDFQTASMSKVTSKNTHTSASTSTSTLPPPPQSQSSSPSSYYAVLDGILLNITSHLRLMACNYNHNYTQHNHQKQRRQVQNLNLSPRGEMNMKMKMKEQQQKMTSSNDNHNHNHNDETKNNPSSDNVLYNFIIQQFLEPITMILNDDGKLPSPSLSNRERQSYVQNILATCTILHRMVLFDVTLSSNVIIGLCDVLLFLYRYKCNDSITIASVSASASASDATSSSSSNNNNSTGGGSSGSTSITDDTKNGEQSDSMLSERLKYVLLSLYRYKNGGNNNDDHDSPSTAHSNGTRSSEDIHYSTRSDKGYDNYHYTMNDNRKRTISSFSTRKKRDQKDEYDNDYTATNATADDKSSSSFMSVQVEDVLAVNCIVLLEQVIGMSLCNTGANAVAAPAVSASANKAKRTGVSTKSKVLSRQQKQLQLVRQQETIGRILSLLNMHLGPELMIPVSTNDMSCMYMYHVRSKRNICTKVAMISSPIGDRSRIVVRQGLSVGAKMMVRLYIYDIVQKLSFHNTRG